MRFVACLPALLLAALIWRLSGTPDLALAHGTLDTVLRKFAHIAAFGCLGAACTHALRSQDVHLPTAIKVGALLALAYAIVDEVHQSYVPSRHGAPSDVAIDALGIGIAAIVLLQVGRHRGIA